MPVESVNRTGKRVTKMKYTPIAAVVGKRVKADNPHTNSLRLVEPSAPDDEQEQVEVYRARIS